eukprot:393249-Amphidinium_carterae.2
MRLAHLTQNPVWSSNTTTSTLNLCDPLPVAVRLASTDHGGAYNLGGCAELGDERSGTPEKPKFVHVGVYSS